MNLSDWYQQACRSAHGIQKKMDQDAERAQRHSTHVSQGSAPDGACELPDYAPDIRSEGVQSREIRVSRYVNQHLVDR